MVFSESAGRPTSLEKSLAKPCAKRELKVRFSPLPAKKKKPGKMTKEEIKLLLSEKIGHLERCLPVLEEIHEKLGANDFFGRIAKLCNGDIVKALTKI